MTVEPDPAPGSEASYFAGLLRLAQAPYALISASFVRRSLGRERVYSLRLATGRREVDAIGWRARAPEDGRIDVHDPMRAAIISADGIACRGERQREVAGAPMKWLASCPYCSEVVELGEGGQLALLVGCDHVVDHDAGGLDPLVLFKPAQAVSDDMVAAVVRAVRAGNWQGQDLLPGREAAFREKVDRLAAATGFDPIAVAAAAQLLISLRHGGAQKAAPPPARTDRLEE